MKLFRHRPIRPEPVPARPRREPGKRAGAWLARWSFWLPFAGASVFILAVTAGATAAAGHPILPFVVAGITTLIFAGGLVLGIAGLRRMKAEGGPGILARALAGVAINGVLLALMVWLGCSMISGTRRAAAERESKAELEARQLTASVGGGAALEKALLAKASQNFAAVLRLLQSRYDTAWGPLTNPPVLEMALVKSRADLRARAEAVRRLVSAAKDLEEFARNTPEIYRQELERHQLSPEARAAEQQQFVGALTAVTPMIIALRQAQVRQAEALLRVVLLLDDNWGRWEYRPASRDLTFKEAKQADAYQLAYLEFNQRSGEARRLQEQLKNRNQ